ncbi:glycosyltransferase, partial [Akkermansiaceae bacterium]|nr:glycosyltransferase [Akkermansiaceae bacterium]
MKIGRIGSYPTTNYQTVGKYMFELCKDESFESYVFAPRLSGDPLGSNGLRTAAFYKPWNRRDFSNFLPLKIILNSLWIIYMTVIQLKAILYFANKKISILHLHSQMYTLVALWAWVARKKVFITFHGEDINNLRSSIILQKLLFPYNKILTIAPNMMGQIDKFFDGEIIYTPNGVDRDIFRDQHLRREKKIFCVASFKAVKRHKCLIDGFAEFLKTSRGRSYKLILAGEGPLEKAAMAQVENLNISGQVEFLGNVISEETVEYYNTCELLVLLSEREGFPKVILE